MTTPKGKDVTANGWKSSGIIEALERGKNDFGGLDLFSDIESLVDSTPHSTEVAGIEMIGYQYSDLTTMMMKRKSGKTLMTEIL